MNAEVRLLVLDDSPSDIALVELELHRSGMTFECCRADSRTSFLLALAEFAPTIVVSDYALPSFDGVEALALARARIPEIPFILISGYIGEERAIEAFEAGITDLVLKDRLSRLAPSVNRALREVEEHREQKRLRENLHSLQSDFAHLARVNDLSQMAAAITHEINQPLSAITNLLHTAREIAERNGQHSLAVDVLEPALEQALRAGHIVHGLRQFIAKGDGEPHAVGAADLVDTAIALTLSNARARGISVVRTSDGAEALVNVDAVQIQQVLVNLLGNAADALGSMPRNAIRNIIVETRILRDQQLVEFVVADTGPGISPDVLERLFEPFVSSKPKGMGIGLSVCRRIIQAHDGTIGAESVRGTGTWFRFRLPLFEPSVD